MPLWYQGVRSSVLILHAIIGVFVFGYSYRRKRGFRWRLPVAIAIAAGIAYWFQRLFYTPGISAVAIMTQSATSIACYLLVLGICCFCLEESFGTVAYVTTFGMAIQGSGGCLKTIVKMIPFINRLAKHNLGILLADFLCYGGLFLAAFFVFRPFTRKRENILGNKSKAIFTAAMLALYLGTTWLSRDYSQGQNQLSPLVSNVYALLLDFMIFAVQYSILEQERMAAHMETMRELIHQQRAQYDASHESVQLINEKYHDLKNLLGSVQAVLPPEELAQLKASIERYDIQVHSGFEVLDVVLTEKMDLCLQRSIDFTCNLGQTDFGFLDEMDLYALFNNAISNAINAVSALPEGKERYILLSANQQNNIVTVHVENPCTGDISFIDGIPQTSKDPAWHGFGMKSMLRTAEKYGGALSASIEDGNFQLDILLLMPVC